MFSDVASTLGPEAAVFSESNGEAYIGDLHGNMALYGWEKCGFVSIECVIIAILVIVRCVGVDELRMQHRCPVFRLCSAATQSTPAF